MNLYYEKPRPKLAQGDIFLDVPHIYLRDESVTFLRRRSTKYGPSADLYLLRDQEHTPRAPFDPEGDEAASVVQLAPALLLTHACEIDQSPKACVNVALIRPLRNVPEGARDAILRGENLRLFPLPENDDPPLEPSYVDFSRVTSLRQNALVACQRIASASPDLLKALYLGLVRYITRYEMTGDSLDTLVEQAIVEALEGGE